MSYEADRVKANRQAQYAQLSNQTAQLKSQLQAWMDTATVLHTGSATQAEKDDVVAMRDQLKADLQAILVA